MVSVTNRAFATPSSKALSACLSVALVLVLCEASTFTRETVARSSVSSSLPSVSSSGYVHRDPNKRPITRRRRQGIPPTRTCLQNPLTSIRGGGSSDYDASSDDETVFAVETSENGTVATVLSLLYRAFLQVYLAGKRAVDAGVEAIAEEYEEEDALPVLARVANVLTGMVYAAVRPPAGETDGGDGDGGAAGGGDRSKSRKRRTRTAGKGEFGNYLAASYGVPLPLPDDDAETPAPSVIVHGGTLTEALHLARTRGRLLVAFVPATKPTSHAGNGKGSAARIYDQTAVESLLGPEVAAVAEKRARKREEGGSFVLWGAKCGSIEANTALKKLKVKKSGDGRSPTLLVAYPSRNADPYGKQTLTPRLLAQHHCNPPPSPTTMSAWLNALRKRHVKQYAAMHHELHELRLLAERTEGYRDSVRTDRERDLREERERRQKEEEERKEEERKEAVRVRRVGLLEAL